MIVAYLQWILVVTWLIFTLQEKYSLRKPNAQILVVVMVAAVLAVPLKEFQLFGYLFGIFGQLSVTTTILVGLSVVLRIYSEKTTESSMPYLLRLIGSWSIVFYPLALGYSPVDPYTWGYKPSVLIYVLISLSVAYWILKQNLSAWILFIVLAGYQISLLESDNIWDYLFDPFLVIYVWFRTIRTGYLIIHAKGYLSKKPAN